MLTVPIVGIGIIAISLAIIVCCHLAPLVGLIHRKNPWLKITKGFFCGVGIVGIYVIPTWPMLVWCIDHINHPVIVWIWFLWAIGCPIVFGGTLYLHKGWKNGMLELYRRQATFIS